MFFGVEGIAGGHLVGVGMVREEGVGVTYFGTGSEKKLLECVDLVVEKQRFS